MKKKRELYYGKYGSLKIFEDSFKGWIKAKKNNVLYFLMIVFTLIKSVVFYSQCVVLLLTVEIS